MGSYANTSQGTSSVGGSLKLLHLESGDSNVESYPAQDAFPVPETIANPLATSL